MSRLIHFEIHCADLDPAERRDTEGIFGAMQPA